MPPAPPDPSDTLGPTARPPRPWATARARRLRWPALAYAAVCVALWPVPVLGLLHAESSAVVAAVAFLVGGVAGGAAVRAGVPLRTVVAEHLALLALPALLLTVTLLWRPNCGIAQGAGLYALLVPPSLLFGVALGVALDAWAVRRPALWGVGVGLAVAAGGVAWDLGLHPQLFTYSHVFGGVLGPIYDEELAVRPGLWAAKAQTLLWAAFLLFAARWKRGRGGVEPREGGAGRRPALAVGALLAASYALAVPLGIQQSAAHLQRALSQRVDLGPLVLHLDPAAPPEEARRLADEALYRYAQVTGALGVAPAEPVDVYLYPDADAKAALIGSRRTSVVPVWLPSPQVHMLADQVPASLGHELVHVVAREFGAPVLRASPAVGLVEGLAVALEPPDGRPAPADLVAAGRALGGDAGGLDADPAAVVTRVMSPAGFWTARAGVAYTASGAFAAWLLDTRGPGPLREAYRTGDFEGAYGESLGALAAAWGRDLAGRPAQPEAVAVAAWLFRRPSLFEVRCPHHVPPAVRHARAGWEALRDGRDGDALAAFDDALAAEPLSAAAEAGRLQALARRGRRPVPADLDRARAAADSLGDALSLRVLADVRRLRGEPGAARAYRAATDSLSVVDAVGRLLLRRRAGWSAPTLAAVLGAPPDSVPPRVEAAAPVAAALGWAQADRPARAWRLARAWDDGALLAGSAPDAAREGGAALDLLRAQLAYRAGATSDAERFAERAAARFRAAGPQSLVAVAEDWAARARWRRGLPPRPRASLGGRGAGR
ncbi:hypothetical protein RQM47_11900 [Rubrivirga sp. S365]|uniref:hypothetical protein n=1 Tax=Rubrivirga sp. S365 TaxID=3076080 RepID=UPI0028CADE41|nr:hypothetical protein [Rubrivirga sp. S365]MDT7857345.1 hypothetical protein [Rubrivirga sp. S365]